MRLTMLRPRGFQLRQLFLMPLDIWMSFFANPLHVRLLHLRIYTFTADALNDFLYGAVLPDIDDVHVPVEVRVPILLMLHRATKSFGATTETTHC